MQRRFCPAACPTRAPMLALLRLFFLFGLNLHRHPILIWERARMKPETGQLGVAQRMKLLSSNWNQLKTLRKVTLDRRRTNLGVQLPGGFSISPRKELLSSVPGLSTTPGKLGRNDERESFIRLATNKKKRILKFFCLSWCPYFGIRVRIMKRRVRMVVAKVVVVCILKCVSLLVLLLLQSSPGAS